MGKKRSKPTAQDAPDLYAPGAIEFFITSISDPHSPRHCGRCLYGALLTFTASADKPTDTPEKMTPSIRRNLDFWNALYHFVVAKRTDAQMEKLLTRLGRCGCTKADAKVIAYHQAGEGAEHGSVQRLWIQANAPEDTKPKYSAERITFIVKAFCTLYSGLGESGVRGVAKGTVETWPTSPADLIPFGADELVASLMQWWRFIPDTIIWQLAARVIRVCRYTLVPSLGKMKFCHSVADATRELVAWAVEVFPDATNVDERDGPDCLLKPIRVISRWSYHTEALLELWRVLWNDLPMDCRMVLLLGCETQWTQLFTLLLYISNDPQTMPHYTHDDIVEHFTRWCWELFRWFHMHLFIPQRPDIPVYPACVLMDDVEFPPPASVRAVHNTASFYIRQFYKESRCSAKGCTGSIQTAGKDFQRCARCQVVSYCGRECQTRAWRGETYPHKRICPILRRLIDTAGGLGMFVPQAKVPEEIKAMPVPPELRYELADGLVIRRWTEAGIPQDEMELVHMWAKDVLKASGMTMPDGTTWTEGYEDYEAVLESVIVKGPQRELQYLFMIELADFDQARYMNRLARWPSEVAKEKTMLEDQPFWERDIRSFFSA